MPLLSYPLVAWGTPDDMTSGSWSTPAGTLAAITTTTDPFGGSLAYTLNDTDGAVASRRQRNIAVTADGVHALFVAAKAGTAAESQVIILETTGGNVRGSVSVTWSGPTFTAGNGGTFHGPIALGNSWYGGILLCAGLTVANGPAIAYRPSGSTAASTGSASFYLRNMVPFSYVDRAVSYARPREGSDFRQGPSGVEAAWLIGPDEILRCTARWIPNAPRSDPTVQAGWSGENESTGVNCGYKAMIKAGWQKNSMLWVPDRSACSTYQTGYLTQPMADEVGLDTNGPFRTFPLEFRGTSPFTAD